MQNKKNPDLATVEELAGISKVSIATIDHYIDLGLLNIAARKGTTRLFKCSLCLKRINQIRELLDQGLLLKEIKKRVINGNNELPKSLTPINTRLRQFKVNRQSVILKGLIFVGFAAGFFYLGRAAGGR